LIERCRVDGRFYESLRRAVSKRRAMFDPRAERAALRRLLHALPSARR
jgi:hypothetical protein